MSELAERSTTSVFLGYVSVLSGDVGRLVVFAVFIPLLVRVVGSDGYGLYALVMATFAVFRKLLNLGLFESLKTHVSRTTDDKQRRIVVTSLTIQLGILTVTLPLLAAGISVLTVDDALRRSLYVLLIAVVGEQLFLFGRGVLHGLNTEGFVELMIPVRSVVLAAVGIGLATIGYGVPGVFAGFAVGFLLTGIVVLAHALNQIGLSSRFPSPSREVATTLIRFGFPSMMLTLLTAGLYKIDIFLIGYFLTSTETGMYRAALQVSEFIWIVAIAMEMVLIQTTSPLWESGRLARISTLTSEMLKYIITVTGILIIGVFVLGENFISIYFGSEYSSSVRALRILLPGIFGFAIARIIWPVLQAGGYLRGVVGVTIAVTILNIVLNVVFIPRFGINGAATATSISYCGMAIGHTLLAYRIGISPLVSVPALRIGGAVFVTGIILWEVAQSMSDIASLLIIPPTGLAIYVACLFGSGVTSPAEIRSFLTEFV